MYARACVFASKRIVHLLLTLLSAKGTWRVKRSKLIILAQSGGIEGPVPSIEEIEHAYAIDYGNDTLAIEGGAGGGVLALQGPPQ